MQNAICKRLLFDTVKFGKLNRARLAEPFVSQIKVGKCIVPIRRRLFFFYPDTGQFQSLTVRTSGDCLRSWFNSNLSNLYYYKLSMKIKHMLLLIAVSTLFLSCSEEKQKDAISDSLSSSLSFNDKLKFLIVYSDEESISDAKRQVARTIGCTKASISRVLNGEMRPSPLMQNEIDNVFRASLKKKSLKSLDKTLNFLERNFMFWHTPDTVDVYLTTINPLYEEIP